MTTTPAVQLTVSPEMMGSPLCDVFQGKFSNGGQLIFIPKEDDDEVVFKGNMNETLEYLNNPTQRG